MARKRLLINLLSYNGSRVALVLTDVNNAYRINATTLVFKTLIVTRSTKNTDRSIVSKLLKVRRYLERAIRRSSSTDEFTFLRRLDAKEIRIAENKRILENRAIGYAWKDHDRLP